MTINKAAINNWPIPAVLLEWGYSLNWYDLCWPNSVVISFPDKHNNNYDLNIQANPYIDWSLLLSRLLHEKTLTLNVFLKADTEWELNELIDDFKKSMSFQEAVFKMPVVLTTWTESREIIVSQESVSIEQPKDKTLNRQCTVVLKATGTPRFYQANYTSKTYEWVTASFNWDVSNLWTAEAYPEYYFVFWTVGTLSNVQITINWYVLEINEAFNTNDILIVNTDILKWWWFVKLNWANIDYNGRLDTPLSTWSNIINFDFVWTFDCNLSVIYKKTYE